MPYIKKGPVRYEALQRLLCWYGLDKGPPLARVLQCSEPTARTRIRDPGLLTLDELDRLNRFGHIPIDELRGAIAPYATKGEIP